MVRAMRTIDRRPDRSIRDPRGCRPWTAAALVAALLAGCGSTPRLPHDIPTDGPGANPPPDLDRVPDAVPRLEAIRKGGPNKPYAVLGQSYTPITDDSPVVETGYASWYGRQFHGRRTASGEVYNMYAMTAAHKTMPIPSYARVRNPANGKEVIVRVNDRGPFARGRVIDLSYTAALKLDALRGITPVEVERITYDEIASGRWMRGAPPPAVPEPVPAPAAAVAAPPVAPVAAVAAAGPAGDDLAGPADLVPPAAPTPRPAAAPPPPNPGPEVATAHTTAAKGFWVQLGAFAQRDGAMTFQRRVVEEVAWLAPMLAIFDERPVHRLQAGPYGSRQEARDAADRIRAALQLVPVIVERR